MVLHCRDKHRRLLPAELSGGHATAGQRLLLPDGCQRPAGGVQGLQAVSAGCNSRLPGLAGALGYSVRQVERLLLAELGAGPLALARAQRAQTARLLIESSTMRMADLAFAAGFASIRQFNDTVRAVFAMAPTELRRRA